MSETPAPAPDRNIFEKIFLSPDERRLRAGWRLLIHTVLFLGLLTCGGIGLSLALNLNSNPNTANETLVSLFGELSFFLAVTVATFLARRFVDRRSIASLGLKLSPWLPVDLLAGLVIAGLIMGFIYLTELELGWTKFESFAWQDGAASAVALGALVWLVTFVIGGWTEELLSRGYHLQNLADGSNLFWGVLISSSIFALLHLANPDASWISTLGILLAGLFLALPYLLTRQLWLSIGLHIGWNFFEGVVFGFPVSGIDTFHLLNHTVSGPVLWTGGGFGPEAGLLVIPAMLLGSILIYGYTRIGNRGHPSQP